MSSILKIKSPMKGLKLCLVEPRVDQGSLYWQYGRLTRRERNSLLPAACLCPWSLIHCSLHSHVLTRFRFLQTAVNYRRCSVFSFSPHRPLPLSLSHALTLTHTHTLRVSLIWLLLSLSVLNSRPAPSSLTSLGSFLSSLRLSTPVSFPALTNLPSNNPTTSLFGQGPVLSWLPIRQVWCRIQLVIAWRTFTSLLL